MHVMQRPLEKHFPNYFFFYSVASQTPETRGFFMIGMSYNLYKKFECAGMLELFADSKRKYEK